MELISVIVPIYQVEPYLNQCIQSLVEQSHTRLEILLVDDGSPDGCPALCDSWAERDSRIRVLHKKNGGLSDARNVGIQAARGDWLGFVDGDDWIAPDFYQLLLQQAREQEAQVAAGGILKVWEQRQEFFGEVCRQGLYTPEQAIDTILKHTGFYAVAWNKLYRRELFRDIRYPVGKQHEDEFVTYRVLDRAERLVLCQQALYYYRQREGSIMAQWSPKRLDGLEARLERLALLKEKYPRLYPWDCAGFCVACTGNYRMLLLNGGDRAQRKRLRQLRRQVQPRRDCWGSLDLKQRIYVLGSGLMPELFAGILNLRGMPDE